MSLVQEPQLGGNSLNFADRCRKGIAKKQGKLFDECEKEFYANIKKNNCSEELAHYVWDVMLKVQRGYSFNKSHCLAYSLVALQEMNLAYRFPMIYWNTACLITDTGGSNNEEEEEGTKVASTNYDKLADGINKMQNEGIVVYPPDINTATFTFKPDEENNRILFGLRGILGVGNDVIDEIIEKRPFTSLNDLMTRTKFNRQAMISLIKSGSLDCFGEREQVMKQYIWETCDKKSKVNLQNLKALLEYNLLPRDGQYQDAFQVYEFNRYLKSVCKNGNLTERAIDYLTKNGYDDIINSDLTLDAKAWKKLYDLYIDDYREYITTNKDKLLEELNKMIFTADYNKYASGNYSAWEMETICYYYNKHELYNINGIKYNLVNFFNLPEEPEVDRTYNFNGREINTFKLHRICGVCISKNKSHGTIKLLTLDGVVEVRFNKEYFSLFDQQISSVGADGKKKVVEKSWFKRGTLLMVQGVRMGNQFSAKSYKSSATHKLYKITSIDKNGDVTLISERAKGELEEDVE